MSAPSASYVGGLIGYYNGQAGTTSNSFYATGSVSGGSGVGGLIGYLVSGGIANCYSLSTITTGGPETGGLVGWVDGGYSDAISYAFASGLAGAGSGSLIGRVDGSGSVTTPSTFADSTVNTNSTSEVADNSVGSPTNLCGFQFFADGNITNTCDFHDRWLGYNQLLEPCKRSLSEAPMATLISEIWISGPNAHSSGLPKIFFIRGASGYNLNRS